MIDSETVERLEDLIKQQEKHALDYRQPGAVSLTTLLDGQAFVHITGIGRFWQSTADFMQTVTDFVISSYGYQDVLTFVLTGDQQTVDLFLSLGRSVEQTQNLLQAIYAGIQFQQDAIFDLGTRLKGRTPHTGLLSGIPTRKNNPAKQEPSDVPTGVNHFVLERLARGLYNISWVYAVQAYPQEKKVALHMRNEVLTQLTWVSTVTRQQIQQSTTATEAPTEHQTRSTATTTSGELVNRPAEYAISLLDRQMERLDLALATGWWQTAVFFGTPQLDHTRRLASLLSGIMAGKDSRPQPIRCHFSQLGTSLNQHLFYTYLNSDEVAMLLPPLRQEAPGYAVNDLATFDVDYRPTGRPAISLGQIQWEKRKLKQTYQVEINQLSRHGAVFGVTGSGKTTTLLNLLYQVWDNKVPFLVIEPAKTEYRAYLGHIRRGRGHGPIPNLRIYTLGNDTIAPFRLNPFEFETSSRPEPAAVLSHIDFLKAVFNAAFILYAPMPYILDMALHEVYEDKGWNLATGTNLRLTDKDWDQQHMYPIFPTLTDLYHKIVPITMALGYEDRIQQDVIAGLQARIGSLRLGAKGLMLDVPRGIPIADLLTHPTVLELEYIGNDDEKTFIMGLLLARMYNYRRQQASEGHLSTQLQHVMVIEEAHRLLKHTSTHVDTESANLQAQAIQTFVNMLSEVRHYGQGILIAEQIPSKLTPDIIKNTNLKIVHRLLAQDDRELLGAAMNMDESQVKYLTTLNPGEAAVYAEGEDHPFLLQMADFKNKKNLRHPLDHDLPTFVKSYITLQYYLPVPQFASYNLRSSHFGAPNIIIYQAIGQLNQSLGDTFWAKIILRTVFARDKLPVLLQQLRQYVASQHSRIPTAHHQTAVNMLLVFGVNSAMQERANDNGWTFALTESLRHDLSEGLINLFQTNELKMAAVALDRFTRAYEKARPATGYYPGCVHCHMPCLYHADTKRMLSSVDMFHVQEAFGVSRNSNAQYRELRSILIGTVKTRWLTSDNQESHEIAYCSGLIAATRLGLDQYEQASFGAKLAQQLLEPPKRDTQK